MRSTLLPAIATLFAFAAALDPQMTREERRADALVVLDITRSMNTRDMGGGSRLDFAKEALTGWISSLPCESRIGLAIFTERRSLTLLEPVEICKDYDALAAVLAEMDWRMAWEGDSLISKGLNHALSRAGDLSVPLVFVTDGHEAPPLPYDGPTAFRAESTGGLILGVGGAEPVPIPKFDDLGRETGFYGVDDLQQAPARIGAPPPDAADRPGYHPRQNPYGESDLEGSEHLTSLKADYLRDLASTRSLGYLELSAGPTAITEALFAHAPSRAVVTGSSLAPNFAALAALLMLALWLFPRFELPKSRKETS